MLKQARGLFHGLVFFRILIFATKPFRLADHQEFWHLLLKRIDYLSVIF